MITQEQLNTEIDLAKRIYLYYFDKYATLLTIGSDKYISWYKDLCILYFLSRGLKAIRIESDKLYIGDSEIDDDTFNLFCLNVREYITSDISDIVYAELDQYGNIKDYSRPATPPTIVTYEGFNQSWESVVIEVLADDQDEVTLPFNIASVNTNSIRIVVNDNDPIPMVDPLEEGVHIIGTTLYWHTYYNLKSGDKIYIQYLLNVS